MRPFASRSWVILGISASLLVAGCHTGAAPIAGRSPLENAAERQAVADLLLREEQWRSARSTPPRYLLVFEYQAFVHPIGCKRKVFNVSHGRSKKRSESRCGERLDRVRDVPGLFALARDLIAEHRGGVEVDYDATFGYPKRFQVWRPGLEDSHFGFEVVEFVPLAAGEPR